MDENAEKGDLSIVGTSGSRELANPAFYKLADVPAEVTWFANLTNPHTRRAYRNDVTGFMVFFGMKEATEFRVVTRAQGSRYARTLLEFNVPALAWPQRPSDTTGWLRQWSSAFDVEPVTRALPD